MKVLLRHLKRWDWILIGAWILIVLICVLFWYLIIGLATN